MDIWLPSNAGDAILYQDNPLVLVGEEQHLPTASLGVGDVSNISEYTWNYDDDNVLNGSNHRTWTAGQMAASKRPLFASKDTEMNELDSSMVAAILLTPVHGILKLWQTNQAARKTRAYINGISSVNRLAFNQENAITLRLNPGDVVTADAPDGGTNFKYVFLPYQHPFTYNGIPIRQLRLKYTDWSDGGSTYLNEMKSSSIVNFNKNSSQLVTGRNNRPAVNIAGTNRKLTFTDVDGSKPLYLLHYDNGAPNGYGATVSTWINKPVHAGVDEYIYWTQSNNAGANYPSMRMLFDTNGKFGLWLGSNSGGNYLRSIAAYAQNTWHHLAVSWKNVHDSATFRLYYNGQRLSGTEVELVSTSGFTWDNQVHTLSTGYLHGDSGPGILQDFLWYSRQLEDAEVTQIYNAQL